MHFLSVSVYHVSYYIQHYPCSSRTPLSLQFPFAAECTGLPQEIWPGIATSYIRISTIISTSYSYSVLLLLFLSLFSLTEFSVLTALQPDRCSPTTEQQTSLIPYIHQQLSRVLLLRIYQSVYHYYYSVLLQSGTVGSADNPAAILLDLEIDRVGANMKLYGQYRIYIESSGHRPES